MWFGVCTDGNFLSVCFDVCVLQAVKFEPYHDSALVRFLLKRALRVRSVSHTVLQCLQYIIWTDDIITQYYCLWSL